VHACFTLSSQLEGDFSDINLASSLGCRSLVPNRAFCLRELAVESTSGGLDPQLRRSGSIDGPASCRCCRKG
jgi:hypothetical protein